MQPFSPDSSSIYYSTADVFAKLHRITNGSLYKDKTRESLSNTKKAHYAEALWTVIERHKRNKSNQYSHFTQQSSFLNRIYIQVSRWISWLRRSEAPLTPDELKLRYAMHLFRNDEPGLLNSTAELPFSEILEAHYQYLCSCKELDNIPEERIAEMGACLKYAQKLERARAVSAEKRQSLVKEVAGEIQSCIGTLKEGQSLYIPGGILSYAGLEEMPEQLDLTQLLRLKTRRTPMIYEVRIDEEHPERLQFRIHHNSLEITEGSNGDLKELKIQIEELFHIEGVLNEGKNSQALEYKLDKNLFASNLEELLEVQTIPCVVEQRGWIDTILYPLTLLKRLVTWRRSTLADQVPGTPGNLFNQLQKGFSGKRFSEVLNKFNAPEQQRRVIVKSDSNPVKMLEIFAKATDDSSLKFRKLVEKTVLYLEIYDASKEKLDQPEIRKWLKDSAINLSKNYRKIFQDYRENDSQNYTNIIMHFQEIVDSLDQASQKNTFSLPQKPGNQKPASTQFDDVVVFDQDLIPLTQFLTASVKPVYKHQPVPQFNPEDPQGTLRQWLVACEECSRSERLNELEYMLKDIYYALDAADENRLWDRLSENDLVEWSEGLERICRYTVQVQFGLQKKGPLPHQILHLLKNLFRCQTLAQRNHNKTGFKDFALEMYAFKDVLKDSYLDLEDEGPEIKEIIKQIEGMGAVHVNLCDPSRQSAQAEADKNYFDAYRALLASKTGDAKDILDPPIKNELEEDFGSGAGKLAPQIIHLRRMKIWTLMMTAKYRCMANPSLPATIKRYIGSVITYLRNNSIDAEEIELKKYFESIEAYLKNANLPNTLSKANYFLHTRPTVHVKETGLDFMDYDHSFLEHLGSPFSWQKTPSQYRETAQEVPDAIGKEVIEACVSNEDSADYIDEEGYALDPEACDERLKAEFVQTGECHTDRFLMSNQTSKLGLPPDRWNEIKLMQTAPLGTRIPNTLAFFLQHPGLLVHPAYGLGLQRVFSLNLFRNNALKEFLREHPKFAEKLVNNILLIAKSLQYNQNLQGMLYILTIIGQIKGVLENLQLENGVDAEYPSMVQALEKEYFQKLGEWKEQCLKQGQLKGDERLIHKTYLLHFARALKTKYKDLKYDAKADKMLEPHLLGILQSYYQAKQIPQPAHERNRTHEDKIAYMMHRLYPSYAELFENDAIRDKFLKELLRMNPPSEGIVNTNTSSTGNSTPSNTTWKRTGDLTYASGNIEIDLKEGLCFSNGKARCRLPDSVTHDPICQGLFGSQAIHDIDSTITRVELHNKRGQQYEFTYQDNKFCIILLPGQKRLIYKETGMPGSTKKRWHQLQNAEFMQTKTRGAESQPLDEKTAILNQAAAMENFRALPADVTEHVFWSSPTDNTFLVETLQGEFLYSGTTNHHITEQLKDTPDSVLIIKKLGNVFTRNKKQVLNPWKNPHFERFLSLADTSQMIALGQDSKVDNIRYANGHEYEWSKDENKWVSKTVKGYALSDKKIEEVLCRTDPSQNFFSSDFSNYHLLEHNTQPFAYKLILACEEYQRATPLDQESSSKKYNRAKTIPLNSGPQEAPTTFYEYDLDPLSGLKPTGLADTPEKYLYLSYVLYTQSKYSLALHYLNKAQNMKPGESEACEQILEWFERWPTKSVQAHAFLLHVRLAKLIQLQRTEKAPFEHPGYFQLLSKVIASHAIYINLEEDNQLDARLKLPLEHRRMLEKICELCMTNRLNSLALDEQIAFDSVMNSAFIAQTQREVNDIKIQKSLNLENETIRLNNEIEELKQKIASEKPLDASHPIKLEEPIPIFRSFEQYLKPGPERKLFVDTNATFQALCETMHNKIFEEGSYEAEILAYLIQDTLSASLAVEKNRITHTGDLEDIEQKLKAKIDALIHNTRMTKQNVTKYFKIPIPVNTVWDKQMDRLREFTQSSENYFQEALYCCAVKDWTSLTNNVVPELCTGVLDDLLASYLEEKTELQQCQKALSHLQLYKESQLQFHLDRLGETLALKRHYNPKTDPCRFALLLLEHEQQVIVNKNQIEHFVDQIVHANLFKHEPLAGGKTTILRNLISHVKADGYHMAGVITDNTLIQQHGPLFEKTTLDAYGRRVERFSFSRADPSDFISLSVILRNLLRVIAEKGRLDTTKNDLLSLHHTFLEKMGALSCDGLSTVDGWRLNQEIDLLSEILQLLKTRAVFGSDEIDKVMNPKIELNYGIGEERRFNETKADAVLMLTKWILSDPKAGPKFRTDQRHKMSKQEIDQLQQLLANKVCDQFFAGQNIDRDAIINYLLTPINPTTPKPIAQQVMGCYEKLINTHKDRNTIVALRAYLQHFIPPSYEQLAGQHFMRSKDGITVKPNDYNATCNELSEKGSEEEAMWYTCLDYMRSAPGGGVSTYQVAQLVLDAQNKAAETALNSLKMGNTPIKYEETEQAKDFLLMFGKKLDETSHADYAELTRQINQHPELLCKFLKAHVFTIPRLREKKIDGNAHDLVNMLDQFYGSSGTSNSYRVLPGKLLEAFKKRPEDYKDYIKKQGVDGSIMMSLLTHFKDSDMVVCTPNKPVIAQIAAQLANNPGSVFIDLAPIFPGKEGDDIARLLSKEMPDKTFRFINKHGEMILHGGTGKIEPMAPSQNRESVITILAKDQERGTHVELSPQSIGFVSVDKYTTLTDFLQAVMRMRKLGQGQTVRYLIDQALFDSLGIPPFVTMLIMLIQNEVKALMNKLHPESAPKEILSYARSAIFDELTKLKDPSLRKLLYPSCAPFFEKPTQRDLNTMGIPALQKNTLDAFVELARRQKTMVEKLIEEIEGLRMEGLRKDGPFRDNDELKSFSEALTKACINLNAVINDPKTNIMDPIYLKPFADVDEVSSGTESIYQQQHQAHNLQEHLQQIEQQRQQSLTAPPDDFIDRPWKDLYLNTLDALAEQAFNPAATGPLRQLNRCSETLSFYEDDILATENLYPENLKPWGLDNISEGLPPEQMRIFRMAVLVDRDTSKVKTILGTPKDFDHHFFHNVDKSAGQQQKYDYYIYNICTDELEGRQTKWLDYPVETQKRIARMITEVKHLAGEVSLLDPKQKTLPYFDQVNIFKEWLEDIMKRRLDIRLLESNLLKYISIKRPSLMAVYLGSSMAAAYKECKALKEG